MSDKLDKVLQIRLSSREQEMIKRAFVGTNVSNMVRMYLITEAEKILENFEMEEVDDFEVQTVNGWVIKEFGYLPSIGESFIYKNLKISISKIGDRKIEEVIVEKLNEQVV